MEFSSKKSINFYWHARVTAARRFLAIRSSSLLRAGRGHRGGRWWPLTAVNVRASGGPRRIPVRGWSHHPAAVSRARAVQHRLID